MPTSPDPVPLAAQLALLARLAEDNHEQLRRLAESLELLTRQHLLLLEQVRRRPGCGEPMNTPPIERFEACRFCGKPVFGRPADLNGVSAHQCCQIHSKENPNQPCVACVAAAQLARSRLHRTG